MRSSASEFRCEDEKSDQCGQQAHQQTGANPFDHPPVKLAKGNVGIGDAENARASGVIYHGSLPKRLACQSEGAR